MKKRFFAFSLFLVLFLSFASAAITECADGDNQCKINNGYSCLNDQISNKTCSNLGSEERIFSLLSVGKCSSEVKSDSKYKSDIKYTSQALIAMKESSSVDSSAKSWLLTKSRVTDNIDWFLEIESPNQTTCTVEYSSSNTIKINEDKTIDSISGGSCLSESTNGYWIEVNPDCFDEQFTISCDKQFLTTLLYKSETSDTIHVSEKTSSASSGGTTKEKVDSLCFGQSACNYEESLWGSLAINSIGENSSHYLPYLITGESENEELLPEVFLYFLTSNVEFKNDLLSKQISGKWWDFDENKYFGTALALYPLQYEEPIQKKDSVTWLLNEAQEDNGCWNSGNIRDTAFILHSISPKSISSGGSGCVASGFFCLSQINCQGDVLPGYSCSGSFVCCTQDIESVSCSAQGGEICAPSENCVGTNSLVSGASGLGSGEVCCLQGTCQNAQASTASLCQTSGGACRPNGCLDSEESSSSSCTFSGDVCCIPKESSGSYTWIWILLFLIILVVLGIVFRDKIRPYWFMIKSKFSGFSGPGPTSYGGPRPPGPSIMPPLRRLPPPQHRPGVQRRIPRARSQGEIDDVLKKLKEIGK